MTNQQIALVPIGQAPQALVYVPDAVPNGDGKQNLQPLGLAGQVTHLYLAPTKGGKVTRNFPTSVSLFDQGLSQVLEASVTGLLPMQPYVLAVAGRPNGNGLVEPLAAFTTNPAGAAIVNAVGPIRQIVRSSQRAQRRYLVIVPGAVGRLGAPAQV